MVAGMGVGCELGGLCGRRWLYDDWCVCGLPLVRLQLGLQVLRGHVEFSLFALRGLRLTLPTAAIKAAAQAAAAVAAGEEATEDKKGLGPPAGEYKVGVDVLFPKLLSHVEPQRAILVIDVSFCGIRQNGVGVVDLLKLVCSLWIIRVLVWVIFQGKFPIGFLNVI